MNLIATYSWAVDVAFFAVLLIGAFAGVAAGFARCFSKIIGTVVSVIFAGAYCAPFSYALESWFGMRSAIAGAIHQERVAAILSIVIAFLALVIVIRLLVFLIGHIASALASRGGAIGVIDRVLGASLGMGIAMSLIMLVLVIMSWINIDSVITLINDSRVVGALFRSQIFESVAALSFL